MGRGRIKTGTLSNETVGTYLQAINRIKQHPVSRRKLKTVTSGHLQQFMDLLSFGGTVEDFVSKGYSIDYIRSYSAVLQQSFRFAVFPKQYITFNPMQYVVMRHKKDNMDRNFYREVTEKNRVHYEYYNLPMTEDAPEDYTEISFVCLKHYLNSLSNRNFYSKVKIYVFWSYASLFSSEYIFISMTLPYSSFRV